MTTENINNMQSFRRVNRLFSSEASDFGDINEQQIFAASDSEEFRCKVCGKLLAKKNSIGAIAGEIKCPRCGAINEI